MNAVCDKMRKAGLDLNVDSVGTSKGGTAGLSVGDMFEACRVYATDVPTGIDIVRWRTIMVHELSFGKII